MAELGVVRRNIARADRAAVDRMASFGATTVHEVMGRIGLMKPYMRPIYPGARVSGTAVTVLLHPGDNWMMHVVAEQIQPGDIVVAGAEWGRVRALIDDQGENIQYAGPSVPVEVLGFNGTPDAGDRVRDDRRGSLRRQRSPTL